MRFLLLLAIGIVPPTAFADAIDDYVNGELKRQGVPGATIAVIKNGAPVKVQGYGLANVEHQVPASRETIYQSGSVGKQFAAMAALLLIEDGKMQLDDPIAQHLPNCPESWKDITVRHLLTHTSGIPDYTSVIDLTRDYTEDELLKKAQSLPLAFEPGTKWSYSNTGYAVLGFLESKVAGKFYGDYLKERVFTPLGMTTARIINEADIIPHRAAGYQYSFGKLKNQSWVAPRLNTTADGSLYVTIDDMIRWDAGLREGKLISRANYEHMWTPVKTKDGKSHPYGFGWGLGKINGRLRQHHGGAWQGFSTFIDRYPDDQVTVIVLMNCAPAILPISYGARPGDLARGILQLTSPELVPQPKAKTDKPGVKP